MLLNDFRQSFQKPAVVRGQRRLETAHTAEEPRPAALAAVKGPDLVHAKELLQEGEKVLPRHPPRQAKVAAEGLPIAEPPRRPDRGSGRLSGGGPLALVPIDALDAKVRSRPAGNQ